MPEAKKNPLLSNAEAVALAQLCGANGLLPLADIDENNLPATLTLTVEQLVQFGDLVRAKIASEGFLAIAANA